MKNNKKDWWKTNFNNSFYAIYYRYLKRDYFTYINNLIEFADIRKEDSILDVACGNGGHLISLEKKGFLKLKGFDYNYAKQAQKNIRKYKILIEKGDMRKEMGKCQYDFIMLNSTSFGYFTDLENKKVLNNCYKALKPKGKLFIDNLSREFVLKNFCSKNWTELQKNVFLLEERKISKDKKKLLSLWILIEKEKISFLSNRLRLYSVNEYKNLFLETGFKKIKCKKMKAHNWFLVIK